MTPLPPQHRPGARKAPRAVVGAAGAKKRSRGRPRREVRLEQVNAPEFSSEQKHAVIRALARLVVDVLLSEEDGHNGITMGDVQ